jgi:hypothetical protein
MIALEDCLLPPLVQEPCFSDLQHRVNMLQVLEAAGFLPYCVWAHPVGLQPGGDGRGERLTDLPLPRAAAYVYPYQAADSKCLCSTKVALPVCMNKLTSRDVSFCHVLRAQLWISLGLLVGARWGRHFQFQASEQQ